MLVLIVIIKQKEGILSISTYNLFMKGKHFLAHIAILNPNIKVMSRNTYSHLHRSSSPWTITAQVDRRWRWPSGGGPPMLACGLDPFCL